MIESPSILSFRLSKISLSIGSRLFRLINVVIKSIRILLFRATRILNAELFNKIFHTDIWSSSNIELKFDEVELKNENIDNTICSIDFEEIEHDSIIENEEIIENEDALL